MAAQFQSQRQERRRHIGPRVHMASPCGGCGVRPGELHDDGCDWALCAANGSQLLICRGDQAGLHECRSNIHNGFYPGTEAALELDLFTYWQPPGPNEQYGTWISCDANHPLARPDLNGAMRCSYWDPRQQQFVPGPRCPHPNLRTVDMVDEDGEPSPLRHCPDCQHIMPVWMEELARASINSRATRTAWHMSEREVNQLITSTAHQSFERDVRAMLADRGALGVNRED